LLKLGPHYGFLGRFYLNKPWYEQTVEQLQQIPRSQYKDQFYHLDNGVIVDQGPPLRIAFQLPGGLLDNFQAIVYDPSEYVMRANQFKADWSNWNDTELKPVKELFGGEMFHCDLIEDNWYLCSFT
jgi:hypothetical protein